MYIRHCRKEYSTCYVYFLHESLHHFICIIFLITCNLFVLPYYISNLKVGSSQPSSHGSWIYIQLSTIKYLSSVPEGGEVYSIQLHEIIVAMILVFLNTYFVWQSSTLIFLKYNIICITMSTELQFRQYYHIVFKSLE